MCDPVTMAVIAVGAGALTAYGQIQAADAAADTQVAQGRSLAQQAGREQDAAIAQAQLIRDAARRQSAEAAAMFSASGVSVERGTPLKIDERINYGGEVDALNTILGADRNARVADQEAAALGKQAKATRRAGRMQAMGTLMSSASSAATASGWRSAGPGFSGTQSPAPISNRSVRIS